MNALLDQVSERITAGFLPSVWNVYGRINLRLTVSYTSLNYIRVSVGDDLAEMFEVYGQDALDDVQDVLNWLIVNLAAAGVVDSVLLTP